MADSDEDAEGTPEFGSRAGTPDMSRLTKRQKSKLGDVYSADLLELPAGIERPSAAKATPLTADEQALKRAEMARRRKNLTDQRLEEEKMDTINKLLKKQTPKMRKSQQGRQTGDATPNEAGGPDGLVEAPPPPKMVRWVSNKDGIRVGVPESWLAGPVGRVFMPQGGGGGALVQEVGEGVVPMEIEA
ncbi:PAPA-1-like conserved region-domain-containing protein [Morchella snyderi]|nr:PAPA-1-like conserved region-domain-containing protein [Morchella snyderi]